MSLLIEPNVKLFGLTSYRFSASNFPEHKLGTQHISLPVRQRHFLFEMVKTSKPKFSINYFIFY